MATPFRARATAARDLLVSHAESAKRLLSSLDFNAVERAGEVLVEAHRDGRTVHCLGNGGSAATASHLATDLAWGRRTGDEARPRAVSLAANVPLMSALANDVGYADVFVEQLRGLFREGDIVVAISASGNSENVLRAARYASDQGGTAIGLIGFDGGKLRECCRICVHVPTPVGAYELVEDIHHIVCHMLANYVKYKAAHRFEGSSHGGIGD
jgi:D-sedoheptulose 7-phosphate isomerase